ncbi:hypothetical protein ACS0TY_001462 [Phlomoides rotata]
MRGHLMIQPSSSLVLTRSSVGKRDPQSPRKGSRRAVARSRGQYQDLDHLPAIVSMLSDKLGECSLTFPDANKNLENLCMVYRDNMEDPDVSYKQDMDFRKDLGPLVFGLSIISENLFSPLQVLLLFQLILCPPSICNVSAACLLGSHTYSPFEKSRTTRMDTKYQIKMNQISIGNSFKYTILIKHFLFIANVGTAIVEITGTLHQPRRLDESPKLPKESEKEEGHKKTVTSLSKETDDSHFLTGSLDKSAKDIRTLKLIKTYVTERPVNAVTMSPLLDHASYKK